MNFLTTLGNVLLSEWLWSITWGIYHVPIAIVVMMFLLKRNTNLRMVPAVLLSVSSNLFSFALYTLAIVGGLIFALGFEYSSSAKISTETILAGDKAFTMYSTGFSEYLTISIFSFFNSPTIV